MINLEEFFELHNDEHGKFEHIEKPLNQRADICLLLLLDQLIPGKNNLIVRSNRYEIIFDIDIEDFSKKVNVNQLLNMIRCGLCYSSSDSCLYKFV